MARYLLGTMLMWALGSPLYFPWILVRYGKYKSWYLTHLFPPFIGGRAIYAWPLCAFFIFSPILAMLPIDDETFMNALGVISLASIFFAAYMMIWTPKWAKPKWQRYIEANYSFREIRNVFVPAWRRMDRYEWSIQLDSEEGIQELVQLARDDHKNRLSNR